MEDIFKAIYAGAKAAQSTQDVQGRVYGIQLAVVADVTDPLELGRIKVLLPSKGAKTLTDWLTRLMPWHGVSAPILTKGDTVVIAFVDGDPHQGVYLGVLQNLINPTYGIDRWVYTTAKAQLSIDSSGTMAYTTGSTRMEVTEQGSVSFTGVNSFTINGKEVAVIGARDSDGDVLVDRGYDPEASGSVATEAYL